MAISNGLRALILWQAGTAGGDDARSAHGRLCIQEKNFGSVSPEHLLDEIGILIKEYGVRGVFDDSGTFQKGEWLETFCKGMIEEATTKKIYGLQHEDKCALPG